MQCPAFEDAAQVLLCGGLFVGVDERKEGATDEPISLLAQVAGEDGVGVYEVEVGGEERPVCEEESAV
jgi:hypothetical protein